jgi:hypothetical protein
LPLSHARLAFLPSYVPDHFSQRQMHGDLVKGLLLRIEPAWQIINECRSHEDLQLQAGPLTVLVYAAGAEVLTAHVVFPDPGSRIVIVAAGQSGVSGCTDLEGLADGQFNRELRQVEELLLTLSRRLGGMLNDAVRERRAVVYACHNSVLASFQRVRPDPWLSFRITDYGDGTATNSAGDQLLRIHIEPVIAAGETAWRSGPKRGRPRLYNRDAIVDHGRTLFELHGPLSPDDPDWCYQSHLIEALKDFCEQKFGMVPSDPTLKRIAREIICRFGSGSNWSKQH